MRPFILFLLLATTLTACRPNMPKVNPQSMAGGPTQEVPVYFTGSRGTTPVTVAVSRKVPADTQPLDYALYHLLRGPNDEESAKGLYSEIPKGTRLLGVEYGPEAVRINLSQQFTSGGGANTMQQRLKELQYTVRSIEKSRPVYVDIEGQELQVLGGEGIIVDEPINRDTQGKIQ